MGKEGWITWSLRKLFFWSFHLLPRSTSLTSGVNRQVQPFRAIRSSSVGSRARREVGKERHVGINGEKHSLFRLLDTSASLPARQTSVASTPQSAHSGRPSRQLPGRRALSQRSAEQPWSAALCDPLKRRQHHCSGSAVAPPARGGAGDAGAPAHQASALLPPRAAAGLLLGVLHAGQVGGSEKRTLSKEACDTTA